MPWREFGILFPVVPEKQEHNKCMIQHRNPHFSFLQLDMVFVFMFTVSPIYKHMRGAGIWQGTRDTLTPWPGWLSPQVLINVSEICGHAGIGTNSFLVAHGAGVCSSSLLSAQ